MSAHSNYASTPFLLTAEDLKGMFGLPGLPVGNALPLAQMSQDGLNILSRSILQTLLRQETGKALRPFHIEWRTIWAYPILLYTCTVCFPKSTTLVAAATIYALDHKRPFIFGRLHNKHPCCDRWNYLITICFFYPIPVRALAMVYQKKIVLHCPRGYRMELDAMVEDFIRDGVSFVGVVGKDCAKVEDIIDELVVGDGSDESRYILTSSHPGDSVDEAIAFARSLTGEFAGEEVQVVEL